MDETFPNPRERLERAYEIHKEVRGFLETLQERGLEQSERNEVATKLLENIIEGVFLHRGPHKRLEEKVSGLFKSTLEEYQAILNSNEPEQGEIPRFIAKTSRLFESSIGLGKWYKVQFGAPSKRLWELYKLAEVKSPDNEELIKYDIPEIVKIPDNLNKCHALAFFHAKAITKQLEGGDSEIQLVNKTWRWLRTGAEMGDREMQYWAGKLILEVEGEGMFIAPDGSNISDDDRIKKAGYYLAEAAEQGHARAQFKLAQLYESGRGCEIDETEALRWYKEAAKQELPEAEENMARIYGRGLLGVKKSWSEKYVWLQRAAEHGSEKAERSINPFQPLALIFAPSLVCLLVIGLLVALWFDDNALYESGSFGEKIMGFLHGAWLAWIMLGLTLIYLYIGIEEPEEYYDLEGGDKRNRPFYLQRKFLNWSTRIQSIIWMPIVLILMLDLYYRDRGGLDFIQKKVGLVREAIQADAGHDEPSTINSKD